MPRQDRPRRPCTCRARRGAGRQPSATRLQQENAELRSELQENAQHLHATMQEHERATEELQSANEEVLSANEELQSINEELETAKEELQSANEELSTINQELQERNRQLGSVNDDLLNLLTSVNLPLVILGRDLRLRRFTPAAEKLFGLIHTDVGRPLGDLRSSFDTPKLEAEVLETIDTMQAREREVVDRQGRFYSLQIRPYRTRENRIDGAVVVLFDVDSLKRALEDANAIVDTAHEPLVILDGDLRVERANRSFYDLFAVAAEATEGKLLHELGDGQWVTGDLRRTLQQVLPREARVTDYVLDHEFPRIGRRTMVLSARRLHYAKGGKDRILLAIEDRTAVQIAAEEREKLLVLETEARQRAEETDRVKDEFVATLSHELRGPLTSIAGWVHVLQTGQADQATAAQARAAIDRGVHAQAKMIDELLDYSRMVKGKLRMAHRPTDLVAAAEAALQAVQAAAAAKEISLALSSDTGRAVILGDPDRLQQIAWNLLSNAVKFTPRGGRVTVSVLLVHSHLELRVSDTGKGIAPGFLPHVFERFRQADGRPNRAEHGLGLGLAIVRSLVELHGGTVRGESPGEGQGATFTVTFPVPTLLLEAGTRRPCRGAPDKPGLGRPRSAPARRRAPARGRGRRGQPADAGSGLRAGRGRGAARGVGAGGARGDRAGRARRADLRYRPARRGRLFADAARARAAPRAGRPRPGAGPHRVRASAGLRESTGIRIRDARRETRRARRAGQSGRSPGRASRRFRPAGTRGSALRQRALPVPCVAGSGHPGGPAPRHAANAPVAVLRTAPREGR